MSINIQLDGKLQKISGQTMTKEKIVEKLGYIPANEATVDANIAELNSNLDVLEGALEDHKNSMSDIDAGSADDEFVIADPSGNVIAKFDDEGLHTTSIEAESFTSNDKELTIIDTDGNKAFSVDENGITHAAKLELNSGDVDDQLSGLDSKISGVSADLAEHAADTTHITSTEREAWNNKSEFSGEFNDLKNSPITEDNSGELVYADEAGNIIFKVAQDGAHTTEVTLPGGKVDERLNQLAADLSAHKTDDNNDSADPIHLQPGERAAWNAKATTKYVENFAATVTDELTKKVTKAEFEGHVAAFAAHEADSVKHITADERSTWNNKSDVKSYNDLPDAPDIAPEDNEDSLAITDSTGNIVLRAGELDEKTTGLETTTIVAEEAKIDNIYTKAEVDAAIADITHEPYVLPIAKADKLGGIKVGAGLSITTAGVLSATGGGTADAVEWDNVLNKPTTVSGFGISNAYTKTEVDATITAGIENAKQYVDDEATELIAIDSGNGNIRFITQKVNPEPGLYEPFSGYKTLKTSWNDLIANGTIQVNSDGAICTYFGFEDPLSIFIDWIIAGNTESPSAPALIGDLVIPADGSVTAIYDCGFEMCTGLTSVKIPSNIALGMHAFCNCTNLNRALIEEGITYLDEGAFTNTTHLTSFVIPESVTRLNSQCFNNSEYIKEKEAYITYVDNWAIGYDFWNDNDRNYLGRTFTFPKYTKGIADNARICSSLGNLTSIDIPDGLKYIGDQAFAGSGHQASIIVPSSVERIGYDAFSGCVDGTTINYIGTEAQWNSIEKDEMWHGDYNYTVVYNYNRTVE